MKKRIGVNKNSKNVRL